MHTEHPSKGLGIVLVGTASLLSGLSAALTQRAITATGTKQRHVLLLSCEMAVYGILFLGANLWVNSDVVAGGSLWSHWTAYTLIPVVSNVSVACTSCVCHN